MLGPSRAGKTSSLVIPNILSAHGAVVSTSTKPDVLLATVGHRASSGWVGLYDPSGTIDLPDGVVRVGWSPVSSSRLWDGALFTADAMVRAARRPGAGMRAGGDDHWVERAASLLAPVLYAAAVGGQPMATVLSWVDRHQGAAALEILTDRPGDQIAADLLAGLLSTEARELSGIWSTASGVLSAYRSSAALASTEGSLLDAEFFCDGPHTLYICAAGRQQQLLAPLIVGLLGDVRDAAYRRAATGGGRAPVLLALDEVANIAPMPDLPALVAEGAGQGLLTLACLQDLSQARARWGRDADSFLSLFGTTVVLAGIADMPTLEALSALAGEEELAVRTLGMSQGADGRVRPSASVSTTRRRRLPLDVIGRGRPGWALAMDPRNRIGWVALTPIHEATRSTRVPGDGRQVDGPARALPAATPERARSGRPLPLPGGRPARDHAPRGRDR